MKLIKKLLRVFYLFKYTDIKYSSLFKDENIIVWIYPQSIFRYFLSDTSVRDFGYITSLSKYKLKHRIYIGKKIGKYSSKVIFCSYHNRYNHFSFKNYTESFVQILKSLEVQGNEVFPSSREAKLWENKTYMHREFRRLGISEPKTCLCQTITDVREANTTFPFLIKEEHSAGSEGIHKICSDNDLEKLLNDRYFDNNSTIICQQLVNMRKDLRVILVHGEIVLHYWRINLSNEWRPTATTFGNDVDFISFPEQWRECIVTTFQKLNIITGAFDITWQNDDLSTIPLFLEVSPTYQPNPKVDLKKLGINYGEFKKKLNIRTNYDKEFIRVLYSIQSKVVLAFLEASSETAFEKVSV